MRAEPSASKLVLHRNAHAARGPSFLDSVVVASSKSLRTMLADFEARRLDLAWFGSGLHKQRHDAKGFDLGTVGWIVLRTGVEAASWDRPGVAQRLLEGLAPSQLDHLGLLVPPASSLRQPWLGPAGQMLVHEGQAHLLEVAHTLASLLSLHGHRIDVVSTRTTEFFARRASRQYCLMLDVVRPLGSSGVSDLLALTAADDAGRAKALATSPPRQPSFDPREIARTLRLGVVGSIRLTGSLVKSTSLGRDVDGGGLDLGQSYIRKP